MTIYGVEIWEYRSYCSKYKFLNDMNKTIYPSIRPVAHGTYLHIASVNILYGSLWKYYLPIYFTTPCEHDLYGHGRDIGSYDYPDCHDSLSLIK